MNMDDENYDNYANDDDAYDDATDDAPDSWKVLLEPVAGLPVGGLEGLPARNSTAAVPACKPASPQASLKRWRW